MKRLLPVIAAVAAYFAAREFRPAPPPVAEIAAAPAPAKPRFELRGLARRADRLANSEAANPALLERLTRAGSLSQSDRWDLVRRSAQADPEGTWAWLESQDFSDNERSNLRRIIAQVWFPLEPQALLGRLDATSYDDWQIAGSLIGLLFGEDPKAAAAARQHLDTLVTLASPSLNTSYLPNNDANSALLLSLPEGRARDALTRQYAAWWLERDVASARVWMKNLPEATQAEIMGSFVERGIRDFSKPETRAAAAAWIRDEADPTTRARLGPVLVEWMARKDPAAALEWASANLSAAPLAHATATLVSGLYSTDPEGARRMVADLPPGNLRHRAAGEIATAWATEEPAAAVDWWLSQVDPAEAAKSSGISAGGKLGEAWFQSDPDSLRARLANPEQAALPMSLAYGAIRQWTKDDPAATLAWAAAQPADRRESFVRTTYRDWAYNDAPSAAADFANQPDSAPSAAAASIVSTWFDRDPDAAIRWTADLPPGPAREAALKSLKRDADFEVQLGGTFPPALQQLLD
jgi:hypothetical protein